MDYKFGKVTEDTGKVDISYDKSIIDTSKVLTPEEAERVAKEYRKEKNTLIGRDSNAKLGLESSLGKDERLFHFRTHVSNQTYITVKSAMDGMHLGRGTILKYAKETGLPIFDEEKKVWLNEDKLKD